MADSFAPPGAQLQKIGVAAFPTPGQGLALDTSGKLPRNLGTISVLQKDSATTDVASTAAEASFSFSNIVAGSMGATGVIRLTVYGDYLHNNVGADTVTVRIKFGGTTLWANSSSLSGNASAVRHPWVLSFLLSNTGTIDSQVMFGSLHSERADTAAPTTGLGAALLSTGNFLNTPLGASGASAIDTTLDQQLVVSAQWSASSANNSWRKRYSLLELF